MLVAVYGTLKQGYGNHAIMLRVGGVLEGTDRIYGYEMYSGGGFPVVYPVDDQSKGIDIEVYRIDDVAPLDSLEGHPRWYRRIEVPTVHGKAWIYLMQDESYKNSWNLLESGNF